MNLDLSDFLYSMSGKLAQQPSPPTLDPGSPYYSGIRPEIDISGEMVQSDIPVSLPDGKVNISSKRLGISGRAGLRGRTQAGAKFGGGVTGNLNRQWLGFPEELQAHGAPAKERVGPGLKLGALDAFYETPGGTRLSARYDNNPQQRGIYGRVKIPF